MKKTIISMAVIAASIFSFSAAAQNPAQQCPNNGSQCPTDAPCVKSECPTLPGKNCYKVKYNPFAGINLTAEQEAKLDNLRQQQLAERKNREQQFKDQERTRRAERDSISRAKRLDGLRQIKAILTPEQYVTFLENMAVSGRSPMGPRFDKGPKPGKDGKFRDGKKGANKNGKKDGKKGDKDRK